MAEPLKQEVLLLQGKCCGSGCQNCPYEPRWVEGTINVKKNITS